MSRDVIVTDGCNATRLSALIHSLSKTTESKRVLYAISNKIKVFEAKSQTDYWRVIGTLYGYKKCCIDEFIKDNLAGNNPSKLRKSYNGFIPCKHCLDTCNEDELRTIGSLGNKLKRFTLVNEKIMRV